MSYLTVWVSSPDSYSERRFGSDSTVLELKTKLELVTGISFHHQIITLQKTHVVAGHGGLGEGPGEKETVAILTGGDDDRTLESFGVKDWMTLRVNSSDRHAAATAGQFTDTSNLERFELTIEEYESRPDTVRAYKLRHKLGRFAPPSPSTSSTEPEPRKPLPDNLMIGARCEVSLSAESELQRRGTVRFIGQTEFGTVKEKEEETIWIGVEYDEPLGKGDGMIEGKRYFQTMPKCATFVKPDKLKIGDFPEIDPFAEDDEDMEM